MRREAAEDEDDCVVDDVRRDGGQQPVVEDEPEHHHADEPRVDPADEAEVLVAVAEGDTCRHYGCAEQPPMLHELRLQRVEREEVGNRHHDDAIPPLHQPEGDEVEERQYHHRIEKREQPEDDLFEHTGIHADPQTLDGLLESTEV